MISKPRLMVSPSDQALIRIEAERAYPNECCGLLIGSRGAAAAKVETVIKAANVADQPKRRFEVDPETLFTAYKGAREAGSEVLGHYHSHPGGEAVPSIHDRARAIARGEVWLIVPVTDSGAGVPQAHLFTGDSFAAMEIIAPQ